MNLVLFLHRTRGGGGARFGSLQMCPGVATPPQTLLATGQGWRQGWAPLPAGEADLGSTGSTLPAPPSGTGPAGVPGAPAPPLGRGAGATSPVPAGRLCRTPLLSSWALACF